MSVTTVVQQRIVHPAAQNRFSTVARTAAIGGVVGAVAGAGLSLTALPFIGALSAPLAAAIGGAAGLILGGIVGIFRSRGGQDGARVGAGLTQLAPPPPGTGSGSTPPPPPPLPR